MKSVMISIRPEWCELIASGKKTIEVRKTCPMTPTPFKCFIYCTQGEMMIIGKDNAATCYMANGKVIGEFVCRLITGLKANNQIQAYYNGTMGTCMREIEIVNYAKGKTIYYWQISDLVIYDKPKELSDFIHPTNGCCNEGKCRGCKWLDRGNGYNLGDDCLADFDTDAYSPMRRAPQSWCYVEELR